MSQWAEIRHLHLVEDVPKSGNGNRKRDPCSHVKWDPQVLRQNINSGPSWLKSVPGLSGRICL